MPIYEYICQECGKKYDKLIRSLSAKIELKCPKCGSPKGRKALSSFSTGSGGGGMMDFSAPACGPVG